MGTPLQGQSQHLRSQRSSDQGCPQRFFLLFAHPKRSRVDCGETIRAFGQAGGHHGTRGGIPVHWNPKGHGDPLAPISDCQEDSEARPWGWDWPVPPPSPLSPNTADLGLSSETQHWAGYLLKCVWCYRSRRRRVTPCYLLRQALVVLWPLVSSSCCPLK